MKFNQLTKIIALGSSSLAIGFLASCKDAPKDEAKKDAPSTEAPEKKAAPEAKPAPAPAPEAKPTPAPAPKPAPAPAPTPEAAAKTVPVYIITVSGSGWGIGNKTSSVLTAQSGVTKVKLSGLRATAFVNEGTSLDKVAITEQLKAKGLGLVSMETAEIGAPVAAYSIKVTGTGWSTTADKVRVALENMDVVSSAFVNKTIELYLNKDVAVDEAAVKTAITGAGAKFVSMKKQDTPSL